MLTCIWKKFLPYPLRLFSSSDQLNSDLVGSAIVMYKAAKVTEVICDPCAAGHLGPFTSVPEDRKTHQSETGLLDDKK